MMKPIVPKVYEIALLLGSAKQKDLLETIRLHLFRIGKSFLTTGVKLEILAVS